MRRLDACWLRYGETLDETKGRYKFPYGDFKHIHRCAVLAAESRAGQRNYADIERAVAHLHDGDHGRAKALDPTAVAPTDSRYRA